MLLTLPTEAQPLDNDDDEALAKAGLTFVAEQQHAGSAQCTRTHDFVALRLRT